ncbi:MAG: PBP1A family penicillin-binding protein [Myxococcaceae bacterium]|nr:PBP1A family penicillin-binding protein [Myxococcaceae bacterium]
MRDVSPPPDEQPTQEPLGDPERHLVLVDVPKRVWWKTALKMVGWLALIAVTAGVFLVVGLYMTFADGLPEIPRVEDYRPPILTEVHTADAVLAGEFYNERRKVVPYERVPKRLVQAFIASEDASFFDHAGVDFLGTGRAVFKTVIKKVTGKGKVQGGSTLTQQTAKAVLSSAEGYKAANERKGVAGVRRKIREAILARNLESQLTKEEILYLYLNNVYLGHHSYGVQAAAENYYRKDVKDLTLAEMALIAGLPQAPSSYSPFRHADAAKKRRSYVLRRMLEEGMISKAEHDIADATEVSVHPVEDVFHEFAPYFTEEVRRSVVDRYTNKVLLDDGLKVYTTMDSERQRAAQDSVFAGLLAVDKRQGFRGVVLELKTEGERKAFIEKSKKVMGAEKLEMNRFYVGLITHIDKDGYVADVTVGSQVAKLPALGMRWARKLNAEQYYPAVMINKVSSALKLGDVVVVRVTDKNGLTDDKEQRNDELAKHVPDNETLVRLEQEPELQSALVSIDPHRQYMVAMVGGYDFDANEFNRAFQACRQPGSSFKPLVYSAAIEKLGWTEATVIVDSPIVYDDPENQNRWKPANYSEEFQGDVLLRTALVNSMNIPAVKTFIAVGIKDMSSWSKQLGLSTKMNEDFSSALGSSCVYPFELVQVYSNFNRLGVSQPTYFIRKIEDRFGRTVEDHTAYDDPWANLRDRVSGGYARLFESGTRVMEAETAYITTDLMRGVVKEGTGAPASRLGKPAAGKTGTTNDSFDAWFTGFTRDLVTTAWVGYDLNPHPLGRYETGGRAALPIWLNYMRAALDGRSQTEFEPPPGLGMVKLRIDNKTGRMASSGSKGAVEMWFKKGTEPKDVQPEKGSVGVDQFMQIPN